MTTNVPIIAALSSRGIVQIEGSESYNEKFLQDDKSSNYRSILFSSNGAYFAWRNDSKVEILRCTNWNVTASISGAVKEMQFSPNGTYLMVWENFVMNTKYPQGRPNMHVYKSETGTLVQSFIQRDQIDWAPFWSSDEKLFARLENKRVLVYEEGNLEQYTQQINCDKFKSFSLGPSKMPPYNFVTFTAGSSGKPSNWKLFKFPSFDLAQTLSGKTLFQGDRAEFYWNNRGTNLLIMTHTDVDKSGASYYGKQCLHYGDTKGNSINITFSKEGPIHAVSWNPGNWNEFCAVYGHAPAKATLFNTKCEPVFEFGTGGWNSIYFSPGGSRLLLGGFGNIAHGNITVWDPATHRQLGTCTAPDTTLLQWDPRAECFVTATTYPRLTVANGFKIWHYTCVLMYEKPWEKGENLLSISWQPGNFPKSNLSTSVPQGITSVTPKPSSQPYRPPGAKGRPSNFVFHEHEAPHKPGQNAGATPSKAALKQKEKREKQKAKKAEEKAKQLESGDVATPTPKPSNRPAFVSTGDPEKDKKIKNVLKKLDAIEKLKETRASGKQLEVNQLAKIETEKTLLAELTQLKL